MKTPNCTSRIVWYALLALTLLFAGPVYAQTIKLQHSYGGAVSGDEIGEKVRHTSDGGYIISGLTSNPPYGFYVVKTDSAGNVQWSDVMQNGAGDAYDIQQTADGGYIVVGSFWSGFTYREDACIFKLFPNGTVDWYTTYGGNTDDFVYNSHRPIHD